MIKFLIINLQQIILNLQKLKIIIKNNPTHLLKVNNKIEKKKLKFNKIMQRLLQ